MALSVGIVGLPNVGKSTLFNALVKRSQASVHNHPFTTIEPNVGVIDVPDDRLQKIARIFNSKKVTPARIKFVDIAGLVKGAHQGEGLGNQFLVHVREADAIVLVTRHFRSPDVVHALGRLDPAADLKTVETELALADLQTLDRAIKAISPKVRTGNQESARVLPLYQKIVKLLNSLDLVSLESEFSKMDSNSQAIVNQLHLMTLKPIIHIDNIDEDQLSDGLANDSLRICAKLEAELVELSNFEQQEYLKSLAIRQTGLDQLIKRAYLTLGLVTFFTSNSSETRAWPIKSGSSMVEAAAKVHTDMAQGFIAAQVISWSDLVTAGSWSQALKQGLVRTQGKSQKVSPGDLIEFRFKTRSRIM